MTEGRGKVALLTLNRPNKLNALNYALIDRLMERLDAIERDAQVRAIVLTGAGDRAFSAGADILNLLRGSGRDKKVVQMLNLIRLRDGRMTTGAPMPPTVV
jgi:enoyl-CoA hydratase/carnithine racemase